MNVTAEQVKAGIEISGGYLGEPETAHWRLQETADVQGTRAIYQTQETGFSVVIGGEQIHPSLGETI